MEHWPNFQHFHNFQQLNQNSFDLHSPDLFPDKNPKTKHSQKIEIFVKYFNNKNTLSKYEFQQRSNFYSSS